MPVLASDQRTQIPLHRMMRGLAKPIATIRLEPQDISSRSGIQFEPAADDLDELEAAVLRSKSGRQFALVRHRHQPNPGTDILTNENSRRLTKDLQEVLQFLRLKRGDLRWIHSAIEPALVPHRITVLEGKRAAARGHWRERVAEAKSRASASDSASAKATLAQIRKAYAAKRARAVAKKH